MRGVSQLNEIVSKGGSIYLGLNEGNNTTLRDNNIAEKFVQPKK